MHISCKSKWSNIFLFTFCKRRISLKENCIGISLNDKCSSSVAKVTFQYFLSMSLWNTNVTLKHGILSSLSSNIVKPFSDILSLLLCEDIMPNVSYVCVFPPNRIQILKNDNVLILFWEFLRYEQNKYSLWFGRGGGGRE